MEELKENNAPRDRAILVGLSSPRLDRKENADEESLEELGALVETAGGVSVGVVLQTLPSRGQGGRDPRAGKVAGGDNGHLRQ